MFCPRCGNQNEQGANFCKVCGAPLAGAPAPAAGASAPQWTYGGAGAGVNAIPTLKRLCSSPKALTAVIAFTASIVFGLINSFVDYSGMLDAVFGYIVRTEPRLAYMIRDYMDSAEGPAVLNIIIGMLPKIVLAAGLWMTYAAAANKRDGGMKTAGITMAKVILVIDLILACVGIALALGLVLVVIAAIGSNADFIREADALIVLMVIILLVIIAAAAVAIPFQALALRTANTIKNTAMTGRVSDRVSGYVAVMSMIIGGFAALGALGSLRSWSALLNNLSTAVYSIAFGMFIFSYRDAMRQLMSGTAYSAAVPPQPSGANAAPKSGSSPESDDMGDQPTTLLSEEDVGTVITCPNCGAKYYSRERSCPRCGRVNN